MILYAYVNKTIFRWDLTRYTDSRYVAEQFAGNMIAQFDLKDYVVDEIEDQMVLADKVTLRVIDMVDVL